MNRIREAIEILAAYLGLMWILASDLEDFGEWFKQNAVGWI